MVLLLWSMSHITGLIVGSVGLGEELDLFITQYRDATIATVVTIVTIVGDGGSGSGSGSSRVILLLRSTMLLHPLVILIMVIMVVMSGQCGKTS